MHPEDNRTTLSVTAAVMRFAGYRVLVADDNPVNQHATVRMLEKLGCLADVANDGQEAVTMHGAQAYDLLLMDCQMPKLDGYQATARIRAMESVSRRTPIVALTAYSTRDEQQKCLAAGMDDFISKPIRPQLLEAVLQRWLQSGLDKPGFGAAGKIDELEEVQATFGADFVELAQLYQADGPMRIALLRQAGAGGDGAQVARLAHAFAGSCAAIGATRLSVLCRELEARAREDALDGFEQKLGAIEAEYNRIDAKLQAMTGAAP